MGTQLEPPKHIKQLKNLPATVFRTGDKSTHQKLRILNVDHPGWHLAWATPFDPPEPWGTQLEPPNLLNSLKNLLATVFCTGDNYAPQ